MNDARTYTWVADTASAGAAARSFARGNRRSARSRMLAVVAWFLAAAIMWTSLADDLDPFARVLWALVYGALILAVALPIGLLGGRLRVRRLFAARLAPGTELTSRFDDTSVALAGPLSRHDLSYDGLVHVERIDGWVHLRQVGSPVSIVWPGELFPDDELRNMRTAIAARSS